jgi:hypothetical protein
MFERFVLVLVVVLGLGFSGKVQAQSEDEHEGDDEEDFQRSKGALVVLNSSEVCGQFSNASH